MAGLIETHMQRPFAWGVSDCCLAACNVWRDMGLPDPAAAYRGRYSDEAGARAVMRGTVEDVAVREFSRLGWLEIHPAEAEDFDAGVIGNSLAIYFGGWWCAKSQDGMILKKRVRRAWRPAR